MDDKKSTESLLPRKDPDRLQQIIHRMQKQYEYFSFEDRNRRIQHDIEQMDENENDRNELLRLLD